MNTTTKKLKRIKRLVESHLEIPDITIKSRQRDYVNARFLYFKIAHNSCRTSLTKIAQVVDRDHATVIHGMKQFDNLVKYNKTEFKYLSDAFVNISSIVSSKEDFNFLDLSSVVTRLDKMKDDIDNVNASIIKLLNEAEQNTIRQDKAKVGNT